MTDDAMERLLAYHRRRYRLVNGWCMRFRITAVEASESRPHGIRYAFTLHDVDMTRLLGFDNAHGVPRRQVFDHQHRFRRADELVPYDFLDADQLLVDFFDAVEQACRTDGVGFTIDAADLDEEGNDDEDVTE